MATLFSRKMQELRTTIRLHANWLVYATLGESALTKSEVTELEKYGKLPMGDTLDLVEKSYLLGRMRAILKRSEYKKISFEHVADEALDIELSPLEELVIEQAQLRAGQALRNLSMAVVDNTMDTIEQTLAQTITEASIRRTIVDQTVLALVYKRSAQDLASELASRLQTAQKRNWAAVARTELHAAKVQGTAQAIINKVDIYANSDGPDSDVSIVPGTVCCADCKQHYIGADGNPKIFKLITLLGAGSNADSGVKHNREKKIHIHWKTTLPPLHPNCGCQIKYIPPGYGWAQGKLELLNKSMFDSNLIKATAGVRGGISPTVKPTGPDGDTPTSKKPTGIPSLPGAAAPGNVAGPGRPSGSLPKPGAGTPGGAGGGQQMAPCPFGGGSECMAHGGNGAAMHKPNGTIMKKHAAALARGAAPVTEEAKQAQEKQLDSESQKFTQQDHPHAKIIQHLQEGEIGKAQKLGGTVNAPHRITIVGNGDGAMKTAYDHKGRYARLQKENNLDEKAVDGMVGDAIGSVPHGTDHYREVGAYKLAMGLGLSDHVPPTVLRYSTGEHDTPVALTSVQHWHDDYKQADDALEAAGFEIKNNAIGAALVAATRQGKERELATKLCEIGVMDIVMNNNDRHSNNLIFSSDMTDVKAIDHGGSFGNGMQGHKNSVAKSISVAGKFGIPEHMQQKLDGMSLNDFKRSMDGSHVEDWAVAQTFLRARYVSQLQNAHGHIPNEALKGVWGSADGKMKMPRPQMGPLGYEDGVEFFQAEQDGKLPEQQFDRFAKTYLTKVAKDPSHPDHEAAKELIAMKPLMGRGMAKDPAAYRAADKHEDHWATTKADYDLDFKHPDREKNLKQLRGQFVRKKGEGMEDNAARLARTPIREVPKMPEPKEGTADTNIEKKPVKEGTVDTVVPGSAPGSKPSQSGVRAKNRGGDTVDMDFEGKTMLKSLYIVDLNKPFPS